MASRRGGCSATPPASRSTATSARRRGRRPARRSPRCAARAAKARPPRCGSSIRPGTGYRYSGGGYTLLQAAIERRTGLAFGAWARRDVLGPLGMRDSRFGPLPGAGAAVASGHDAAGRPAPDFRYAELAAAGLTATAADLGRFAAAILRDPGRLDRPQPATGGQYGLGVHLDRLDGGVLRVSHPGVNRGWYARLLAYPGRGWAAVVLTNGDRGSAVADAVEHELER